MKLSAWRAPEKDVEAQKIFKAAGAEIVSSDDAVARGLTTVAAPLAKRIALSALSFRAAKLNVITPQILQPVWLAVGLQCCFFGAV